MPRSRRVLRSRHLVPLVFGLAVLPLIGLVWAGYVLFAQERALESQRRSKRLERTADLIVKDLQAALSDAELALTAGQETWSNGAVAATLYRDRVAVKPSGRIAFLPVAERFPKSDEGTSGSKLLPVARTLLASGKTDEALQMFNRLLDAPPFLVGDAPSHIAARYARCLILERSGRSADLHVEAARLGADMRSFAPYLTGASYQLYAEDVNRWSETPMPNAPVAVSAALAVLWERWAAHAFRAGTSGRELIDGSQETFALWHAFPDRLVALLAPGDFAATEWAPRAAAIARAHNAELVGLTGRSDTIRDVAPIDVETVKRPAGQSGVPWAITLAALPTPDDAPFGPQRTILLLSFATLLLMMGTASYFIVRSVNRDLAVVRLQSDFVSAVSHEFRTPLTALKQFVEVLREQPSLSDERRRQCYDAQNRAVDRLSRLVESLLDFGRVEAGTMHYHLAPQDCVVLARAVVIEFNQHAQTQGYQAEVEGDSTAVVRVDPEAVSRALRNLLDNAMKYSPDHKAIRVRIRTASNTVRIEVIDRGIGVATRESRQIFGRFHRGAEARARGIPGTGIGLAMVAEIMRAHGGNVVLESRPGSGSTFTLVFPFVI